MLIEQLSYSNRWRRVHPAAKCVFALCGMIAAFAASTPTIALLLAALLAAVTCRGARIPLRCYLRVSAAPLLFLLVSGTTLAVSLGWQASFPWLTLSSGDVQLREALHVAGRSLVCLAALLFLALSTPLNDLISLLRRLGFPEVLTDLMTLCYRTLFVFLEATHDIVTAQASRLGYATPRLALRSLGIMVAALTVQVWQRSRALQQAALSRANDGPLRFLTPTYPDGASSILVGLTAGCLLIILAVMHP
ncbi:cobalt ECF transporter T component CbiQ [Pelobacter propionicus]|uniref:Cobalt ABC transporter, inner membrane subunit CbiQ n=1 Tax=Pelobacter propionicus (strain DSM 2379 / NBRC 103807 / OttBd1) TaxID=338966 RepID=A1ANC5_PELPD|nr:cobalt ECF transporter T component CbiQ [Pelobacter propionicus]ABK98845.1 cobalt ABC transporter, inner membrane subunit CbiQ [Pelobacter propionicus DSM 2379]